MRAGLLGGEKGGIGKTTMSVHLAMWKAAEGRNAMVVDADPQSHATRQMRQPKQPGLYNLLVRPDEEEGKWQKVLRQVQPEVYGGGGNLYVVPSNVETRGIPLMMADVYTLDTRLRQLERFVDEVVIDTPPTPSLLHSAILMASDWMIYLTELEFNSLDSLLETMKHVKEANTRRSQSGGRAIRQLGIIPMMFRAGTRNHADNLAALQEQFGDLVWNPIALSTDWPSAGQVQEPVWSYAPNSQATKDWYAFIERFDHEMEAVK